MISLAIISRIKDSVSLIELVAEYGCNLIKSGADYIVLCPFHSEKTPSCRVHKNRYYCFGCEAKGSAFDWVKHHEQCSFPEALRILAERAGISLDDKPITRLQAAYAREEADYCKWWWEHRAADLTEATNDCVAEWSASSAWAARSLERINRWLRSLTIPERIQIFREKRTDADRREWQASVAADKEWEGFWVFVMQRPDGLNAFVRLLANHHFRKFGERDPFANT